MGSPLQRARYTNPIREYLQKCALLSQARAGAVRQENGRRNGREVTQTPTPAGVLHSRGLRKLPRVYFFLAGARRLLRNEIPLRIAFC
jgi:hypothetical protein